MRYGLELAALLIACMSIANQCSEADAQAWSADEVTIARHCVSERSFALVGDCRVIAWIDRRNAERRGLTIGEWMARAHSAHLRSPSRPWIAELDASGTEPPSWPATYSWTEARPRWIETLAIVREVLRGGSHGCAGVPLAWGGPRVDRDGLDRWYARGYERIDCGATRNEFVGRRR